MEATAASLVRIAANPCRAPDAGRTVPLTRRMARVANALEEKDRIIEGYRTELAEATERVHRLESWIAEREAALARLREFEAEVKGTLAYRVYARAKSLLISAGWPGAHGRTREPPLRGS